MAEYTGGVFDSNVFDCAVFDCGTLVDGAPGPDIYKEIQKNIKKEDREIIDIVMSLVTSGILDE